MLLLAACSSTNPSALTRMRHYALLIRRANGNLRRTRAREQKTRVPMRILLQGRHQLPHLPSQRRQLERPPLHPRRRHWLIEAEALVTSCLRAAAMDPRPWYDYCARRYPGFNPQTGYFLSARDGRSLFLPLELIPELGYGGDQRT